MALEKLKLMTLEKLKLVAIERVKLFFLTRECGCQNVAQGDPWKPWVAINNFSGAHQMGERSFAEKPPQLEITSFEIDKHAINYLKN